MIKCLLALLTALAGLIFSLLSALGLTEGVCVSEGCNLFRGTAFLGIDLYWFGAFFFGVTAALIARQMSRRDPPWGRRPSLLLTSWLIIGLIVSAFLLGVQALTTPCLSCLIVAGLLGATAWLLSSSIFLSKTLLIWALVMVAALSGLLRQNFEPVPVFGQPDAAVKLFFAPSCPSCLRELQELVEWEELHPRLALYPLTLEPADLTIIHHFRQELASSGSLVAAVSVLGEADREKPGAREMWQIRLISFRNQAFLAGIGARTVPYLLTSAPALLAVPAASGIEPPDEGCEFNRREGEICTEEEPASFFNIEILRSLP